MLIASYKFALFGLRFSKIFSVIHSVNVNLSNKDLLIFRKIVDEIWLLLFIKKNTA